MFVDRVKLFVRAGDGGRGANSFLRMRGGTRQSPNGGHGGDGGAVRVRCEVGLRTLSHLREHPHIVAGRGGHGGGNHRHGAQGADVVVRVPVGTLVKDGDRGTTLRDLTRLGDECLVAPGGRGGQGNRRVHEATPGAPGGSLTLVLELKLVADVGLIGYPNSGKSTLLGRLTRARSRVGAYPFTTTLPVLGMMEDEAGEPLVVADIPGLIEGAHRGRGLGLAFLRHIERTRLLVHLVDMGAVEGRDPLGDFATVNRELERYNPQVLRKPQLVVANKMDLPGAAARLRRLQTHLRRSVYAISARRGDGIAALARAIRTAALSAPPPR